MPSPSFPGSRLTSRTQLALILLFVAVAFVDVGCATARDEERPSGRVEPPHGADDEDGPTVVDDGGAVAPPPKRAAGSDPERRMVVHLLDVGQGAATLIEFPCGAMLVDTGGEHNDAFDSVPRLKEQLDAFFERRPDLRRTIDLLVITHPHIDHVRGVPMLLREYVVKNVVDDGRDGDALVKEQVQALRGYVAAHGTGYRGVKDDALIEKGGLRDDVIDPFRCKAVDPVVRVLSGAVGADPGWGTDNYGKLHHDNENNHSVVVRVDVGNASLLITGDLEERAIAGLIERYRGTRWLDVDLYQVGHHGSANGTTRALVAAMTPHVALIAMGPESRHIPWTAWTYGHPRADVVDRLERGVSLGRPHTTVPVASGPKKFAPHGLDKAIYGTGWDGAIDVVMDADGNIDVLAPAPAGGPRAER
jgi:competence protein ComEC